MTRYLPIILGAVLIVVLTGVQSVMSDRFSDTNVTAEQKKELLNSVPKSFGDWEGKELQVTDDVRSTSGAVGCVSREYRNTRTGEVVNLWLIVGHSHEISAHTPDICFPSSGFSMRSSNSLYPFVSDGKSQNADFWTNTFVKENAQGRSLERVFWGWYNPKNNQPVVWQAVNNPKFVFGNARALFKMYFSSGMRDPNESAEQSSAAKFGQEFLPIINKILAESDIKSTPEGAAAAKGSTAPAAEKPAAE